MQSVDDSGSRTDRYIWVDSNGALRISTSEPSDQDSDGSPIAASGVTLDSAFDSGSAIDGATSSGAAVTIGGSGAADISFYHDGSNGYIVSNTGDLFLNAAGGDVNLGDENLVTTGNLQVNSDSNKLTLGASGASDAYLQFDGTDLLFYDSNYGGTISLSSLAGSNLSGPTVTGDMTISDGKLDWTNASDETAGTWSFDAVTTGNALVISGDALTSGTLVLLSATEGTLNGGYYLRMYDETASGTVFGVKEDGEVEITGAVGSDMLTISAGDLQLDNGKFEVDTTQDITSYVKRNHATSSSPVVEIEQTHTGATGTALLIDQNATGNAKALEISHDGDYAAIDISAGAARTGNVIDINMANQLAETALDVHGAATGTAGEGIVHVDVTGALAGNAIRVDSTGANLATGQLLYVKSAGNQAAATNGIVAYFEDTGAAQATSYAVYISSTNNEALKVDAGESVFDEKVTISDDLAVTVADSANVDAITVTQSDATNNKDGVVISFAGTGYGLKASNSDAGGHVALFQAGVASTTPPLVEVDGTTNNWVGAATTGMLELHSDGTLAATTANLLRIEFSGTSASGGLGTCLSVNDTGTSGGGTEYSVYINATNHEALKVDAGQAVFDELVDMSGEGMKTKLSTADVSNPPTNAELDSAFGAVGQTAGFIGVVDDAGGGSNVWIVTHDGTDWWYVAMTKAA
ncbi:MAG: hypothetical protein JRI45_06600 [Deltaproteobacteria bacterium]|nr:hypothetical protein [Deltaproteobacteria bacterium]